MWTVFVDCDAVILLIVIHTDRHHSCRSSKTRSYAENFIYMRLRASVCLPLCVWSMAIVTNTTQFFPPTKMY